MRNFLSSLLRRYIKIEGPKLPRLPGQAVRFFVTYWPWLSLALGVTVIWGAYRQLQQTTIIDTAMEVTNQLAEAFAASSQAISPDNLFWISQIMCIGGGVLLIISFPSLKQYSLHGWRLSVGAATLLSFSGLLGLLSNYDSDSRPLIPFFIAIIGLCFLRDAKKHYRDQPAIIKSDSKGRGLL